MSSATLVECCHDLLCRALRIAEQLFLEAAAGYDSRFKLVGARLVLICESSRGRHEYYGEQARIINRLILKNMFNSVAVEADWPDAYPIPRGESHDNAG